MSNMQNQIKAVNIIKQKGGTALKVELEANLNRGDYGSGDNACGGCDGEGSWSCGDCGGRGSWTCSHCDGEGTIEVTSGIDPLAPVTAEECEFCDSGYIYCNDCTDGRIECDDCDGEPSSNSDGQAWGSESYCFNWLMNDIATRTGTSRNGEDNNFDYSQTNPFPWMKYAKFYNDGSVDSELTFTVTLDNPDNVFYIPKVLESFKALASAIGEELEVEGAGLHTAVLFSPDASYPNGDDDYTRADVSSSNRLPSNQLVNFKRAMTQLLPALYFLGTSNHISRGLSYRRPNISVDYRRDENYGTSSKYSAISYRYGAMEFRVFDTCYDTPNAILDNIVVIANSFKYLSDEYKSPNLHKIVEELRFGNDSSNDLDRFYTSVSHLDVLNAGLSRLKPSYYTITQLKQQRGFKRTKRTVKGLRKDFERKAQLAYEEYAERFEYEKRAVELRAMSTFLENISRMRTRSQLNMETLEKEAKESALSYTQSWAKSHFSSAETYIGRRITEYEQQLHGNYSLSFN